MCCRSVLCVSTVRFVVCCRGVFAVGADTHIAGLETVKQNVLAGTSNWAAKVAITGTRPAHGLHAMTAQRGLLSRQSISTLSYCSSLFVEHIFCRSNVDL